MEKLTVIFIFLLLTLMWLDVGRAEQVKKIPDQVWSKAQGQVTVRVVVSLNVSWRPEGYLTDAETRAQRSAIAESQPALISKLSGTKCRITGQFKFVPGIGLEVDSAALEILDRSKIVTQVTEDLPERIHTPPRASVKAESLSSSILETGH